MLNSLLSYNQFYLVGIKGVAMTSLAQCLLDADKSVQGSDVDEEFVTQPILDKLNLKISPLASDLPDTIDCLIYTAAHQGPANLQVKTAQQKGIATYSHAEALGSLFNQKKGIAVSGVGGKSTVSAMITWILTWLAQNDPQNYQTPSFSVGVGNIIDLNKTGQWQADSSLFVAEADDYVTDPLAPSKGEAITARFSFLQPQVTVCTNLKYDHPDVYQDFDQTKQTFKSFFEQTKAEGSLVINGDDQELLTLATAVAEKKSLNLVTYGTQSHNQIQLQQQQISQKKNLAHFQADADYQLELTIPGAFNIMNALAALATCKIIGIDYHQSIEALKSFKSTKRRFEYIGQKNQVDYYDDYAHHPHEVAAAIQAINAWSPDKNVVIAFQSHTYSRTKKLFDQFVDAFSTAQEVVMIDIFSSAREEQDLSVSSDTLCQAISATYPNIKCQNLHTIENLARFCQTSLQPNSVLITLGAGDIYKVHDLIKV